MASLPTHRRRPSRRSVLAAALVSSVPFVRSTARARAAGGTWSTFADSPAFEGGTVRGLAVDPGGNVYVAGDLPYPVCVFDPDGVWIGAWSESATGLTRFNGAWSIAVSSQDVVFATDARRDRVLSFEPSGAKRGEFGQRGAAPGHLDSPWGIATDVHGNAYVADSGNHRIQVFDPEGHLLGLFGQSGRRPGELLEPSGVAVGRDGAIYVADTGNHRIQVFSPEGELINSWGRLGTGTDRLQRPRSIALSHTGDVYVADTANNRIQHFTQDGVFVEQISRVYDLFRADTPPGSFYEPASIAIDSQSRVYAGSSLSGGSVQRYSPPT